MLKEEYGIEPAGMLGHSAGEIACGYADGCLTREQTVLIAYHRGAFCCTPMTPSQPPAAAWTPMRQCLLQHAHFPYILQAQGMFGLGVVFGPAALDQISRMKVSATCDMRSSAAVSSHHRGLTGSTPEDPKGCCSKGNIANAGRMAPEQNVTGGLMAAVGLSAEAAEARLQKEGLHSTVVGCDNSPTSVTLAGRCP